jgi:hypothetical protein
MRRGVADAFDESVRGCLIAFVVGDVEHQSGVPLDGDECVAVAKVIVRGLYTFLILAHKRQQLIQFDVTAFGPGGCPAP